MHCKRKIRRNSKFAVVTLFLPCGRFGFVTRSGARDGVADCPLPYLKLNACDGSWLPRASSPDET
jgi:hypothetical protein